ncbi:MAG: hypothetical protein ACREVQ_13945 [Burkholderiales bacterium]
MARKKRKAASGGKTRQELQTLRQRLDKLLGQAKRAERDFQARYAKQLQALRVRQAQAKKAAQKLGRRSAAAAPSLKAGLRRAWVELNEAVKQAAANFRKTS